MLMNEIKNILENAFRPAEVPANETLFLQKIAHETVHSTRKLHS